MTPYYEEMKKKALALFRAKKYEESEPLYREILGHLQSAPESLDNLQERQRVLNNLLVGMYHEWHASSGRDSARQDEFGRRLGEYLDVSEKLPPDALRSGSPHIVSELYRYALRLALAWNTEDPGTPPEEQKTKLQIEVRQLHDRFFGVFCRQEVFPYEILLNPSLEILYLERTNVLRPGHLRQNYYNTLWLAEVFLEILREPQWARTRSELLLLCSDVSLFLPPPSHLARHRFAAELAAIDWLQKSLQEYPENPVARERRQQLLSFLTSAEQINRFRHDVVSKIESIRGLLVHLQEKCPDETRTEVQAALLHVRGVLGSFRLTMKEKPAFRSIASMKEWLERFCASGVEIETSGTPRPVQTDEDYLGIILQNLIQNAHEAYARHGISNGIIRLSFDYGSLVLGIRDFAGGIPEELRRDDRLFEPYVSSKGIQQNTGLGLANVREACRLLGIEIRYEIIHEFGKIGTQFYLKLNEPERD